MRTIFMSTENCRKNEPLRFRLTLADKFKLKYRNKTMTVLNLNIHYTWKNIKSAYKNNKLKISAPTWNDGLDLPYGSYSI